MLSLELEFPADEVLHAFAHELLRNPIAYPKRHHQGHSLKPPDHGLDVNLLSLCENSLVNLVDNVFLLQSWQDEAEFRIEAFEQPCVNVVWVDVCH